MNCKLCGRDLIPHGQAENPDDPRIDCGGDCLGCIREIETAWDISPGPQDETEGSA